MTSMQRSSISDTYLLASKVKSRLTKEAVRSDVNLHRLVCQANLLDGLIEFLNDKQSSVKTASASEASRVSFESIHSPPKDEKHVKFMIQDSRKATEFDDYDSSDDSDFDSDDSDYENEYDYDYEYLNEGYEEDDDNEEQEQELVARAHNINNSIKKPYLSYDADEDDDNKFIEVSNEYNSEESEISEDEDEEFGHGLSRVTSQKHYHYNNPYTLSHSTSSSVNLNQNPRSPDTTIITTTVIYSSDDDDDDEDDDDYDLGEEAHDLPSLSSCSSASSNEELHHDDDDDEVDNIPHKVELLECDLGDLEQMKSLLLSSSNQEKPFVTTTVF